MCKFNMEHDWNMPEAHITELSQRLDRCVRLNTSGALGKHLQVAKISRFANGRKQQHSAFTICMAVQDAFFTLPILSSRYNPLPRFTRPFSDG